MSGRNQVVVITPFTLAGAMAPITLAGALVQQNAEALAGSGAHPVVRPGRPRSTAASPPTSTCARAPRRSARPSTPAPPWSAASSPAATALPTGRRTCPPSNAVDAQAGYESVWALWGAIMGGANFVMHGAGWMEGGLHASYEKMVIDADLLHMVATLLAPLDVDDDALAVDAIAGVGPAGHFFGEPHTQSRYADRVLRTDGQRLAQLGDLDRGRHAPTHVQRPTRSPAPSSPNYEPPPHRRRRPRRASRLRRPPNRRGRRRDRLLRSNRVEPNGAAQ